MSYTVYRGPAQIEYASVKYETKGDVIVNMMPETFDVMTDAFGTVDTRLKSRMYTVDFEPTGQWDAEATAAILAAAARLSGVSIMGGALVIKPYVSAQTVLTLDRAGVTKLPTLRLGASKTLFGGMQFTALETAGATTGVIGAASVYAAPTSTFDPANILTMPWKGDWTNAALDTGSGFLTGIDTEDGWEISCELETDVARVDAVGVTDIFQTDFKVTATCIPVGLTETELLAALQRSGTNEGLVPGESLHSKIVTTGASLDKRTLRLYTPAGHEIVVQYAGLKAGTMRYGNKVGRLGALTFVGLRKFTSGVPVEMLTFDL